MNSQRVGPMSDPIADLHLLLDEVRRYLTMLENRCNSHRKDYLEFAEWSTSAMEGLQSRFRDVEQRMDELEHRW